MIATATVFCLSFAVLTFDRHYYGQPSAALWKDQIFVYIAERDSVAGWLFRGSFFPTQNEVDVPLRHWAHIGGLFATTQAKLDIRDDRLLLFEAGRGPGIYPLVEVPLLEYSEFGELFRQSRGYKNLTWVTSKFSSGVGNRLLFPEHRPADAAVKRPGVFGGGGEPDPELEYIRTARYDVQIAGPKSVRLFHAHKGTLFVSVEPDYLNNWYFDDDGKVAKNLPKPPERELRTGKLPADFTERFAAYTSGERDYLVTDSGKVYLCVPKGKAEVEVYAVWTDPKRRIVGVVQDQANGAVYGWGLVTDSAAPERFYVKFEPKPVAVAYKRTVPLWNRRGDAYLESYECARAFRK
jgi:hypothetical protein